MDAYKVGVQTTDTFDVDKNYFDLQVHIDWMGKQSRTLKAYAIPVELGILMPLAWDNPEKTALRISPIEHLSLNDMKGDNKNQELFRTIGSVRAPHLYETVRERIRSAFDLVSIPKTIQPVTSELNIVPIKLFLAIDLYSRAYVIDAEASDKLDLLLDKLALLMLLPVIENQFTQFINSAATIDPAEKRLETFNTSLSDAVVNDARLQINKLRDPRLFSSSANLMMTAEIWDSLKTLYSPMTPDVLLIPIDVLDQLLVDGLKANFDTATKILTDDVRQKLLDEILVRAPESPSLTYRILYPAIDRIRLHWNLGEERERLNTYKLPYRKTLPRLLPVIEEIDVRPQVWTREANALAIERAIAQKRRELLMKVLSKDDIKELTTINNQSNDMRLANRGLFEVDRMIESLRQEVTKAGYNLLDNDTPTGKIGPFNGLNVTRTVASKRIVQVPRPILRSWTEQYVDNECAYFFGARICRPVYKERVQFGAGIWFETIVINDTAQETIKVEWNPLQNYLSQKIPKQTYEAYGSNGVSDSSRTTDNWKIILSALRKPDTTNSNEVINALKDVRIFELYSNGYRDQNGCSIESVLREAEDELTRARLLLILPVYERRIDGSIALIRYLAVHNPLASRRSYLAPRVFLVESYEHIFMQLPGHWLGPISHSVCLFPGELRRIRIASETRLVTQQRRESRSSERTAIETKANVRAQVRSDLAEERKDAKQGNWNANTSGGVNFGFWNAGGGASGGESWQRSTESVAKSLNDRVEETLNSASTSNEVQFSTFSDTTATEVTSSEETFEILNVNQGRALTHKFFQIMHKYKSSVKMRDARIVLEYPEQLIPGLGMYQTEVYSLEQIDNMFQELAPLDRDEVLELLKEAVKTRLRDTVEERDGKLKIRQIELDSVERYVNSGAYFVDTEVSTSPATEPYVNDARTAEIDVQKARADAIREGKFILPEGFRLITLSNEGKDKS